MIFEGCLPRATLTHNNSLLLIVNALWPFGRQLVVAFPTRAADRQPPVCRSARLLGGLETGLWSDIRR